MFTADGVHSTALKDGGSLSSPATYLGSAMVSPEQPVYTGANLSYSFAGQKQLLELQVKFEEVKTRKTEADVTVLTHMSDVSHISSAHSFEIAKAGKLVLKFDEINPDLLSFLSEA